MDNNIKKSQTDYRKLFMDKFRLLTQTRSSWQVWEDFIKATAISISNVTNPNETREKEFEDCIKRLGNKNDIAELFGIIISAINDNPEQDFLGSLYMNLNLGNHWKGQFFTPYNICKLMSEVTLSKIEDDIEEKGWVSINDCACGAGATLIAAANSIRNHGINYQNHALFVAQDIDRVVGLMCYIQLSLLGCAGYVVIADSICNPLVGGNALIPIPNKTQEIWYTPMYESNIWLCRRVFNLLNQEEIK